MLQLKTTKNTQNFTREEAIMMSKQLVKKGDIVLIAGKGHESYQEIDGKLYPFNDLTLQKNILR